MRPNTSTSGIRSRVTRLWMKRLVISFVAEVEVHLSHPGQASGYTATMQRCTHPSSIIALSEQKDIRIAPKTPI